jgi:Protein of unknown function (DUF1615)
MVRLLRCLGPLAAAALIVGLAGCAVDAPRPGTQPPRPADVRAQITALIPASVPDRSGWAVDIYAALGSLRIEPTAEQVCAVLAVIEQESTYRADPPVPRLGAIAREEIDRRADKAGVPSLLVSAALQLRSTDGRSYAERIEAAKTERELSELFVDFIGEVPLGRRLFAAYNPVRTGGPMQVSIDFAERHARAKPYPYAGSATYASVRSEVFTRRGGLYFGIAHLLDYPAHYDRPIYRFADFNAGHYASRNAAFQSAVSLASGIPLDLDGDLLLPGAAAEQLGSTERAVRSLADRLGLGNEAIRRALAQGETAEFEQTRLYERVFELAERLDRRPQPRAVLPRIQLKSPKITRQLTTEWFARRVDERHQRCMARSSG